MSVDIKAIRELCATDTDGPWGQARQNFIDKAKEIIPALLDELEQAQNCCHQASNEPLTLEKLQQMDGEPVRVISLVNRFEPFWGIISLHNQMVLDVWGEALEFDDYGITWISYRRKPESEE